MKIFFRESLFTFSSLLIIVLAACSGASQETPPPATENSIPVTEVGNGETARPAAGGENVLQGTQWRLIRMGPAGAEQIPVEGSEITLSFENDSTAGGSSGCNSYGGEYEVADDRITFLNVFSTAMACEAPGVMDQEQAYLNAIQNAENFELSGDQLTITSDAGASQLIFSAAR